MRSAVGITAVSLVCHALNLELRVFNASCGLKALDV